MTIYYEVSDLKVFPEFDPKLIDAYNLAVKLYSNRPDLQGVDIGFKYITKKHKSGKAYQAITGELAIRFLVLEKVDPLLLSRNTTFPPSLEGIVTDVVEVNRLTRGESGWQETTKSDAVRPGMMIQDFYGSEVTLGLLVRRFTGGPVMGLTCFHLFDTDKLEYLQKEIKIFRSDTGGLIGYLHQWICNTMGDAALIRFIDQNVEFGLLQAPNTIVDKSRMVRLGERLSMYGTGTNDRRNGVVDGIGCRFLHDYKLYPRTLMEGFRIIPTQRDPNSGVSQGGDSGAIWFSRDGNYGVGISIAEEGSDQFPEHAFACHLDPVLETFGVFPARADGERIAPMAQQPETDFLDSLRRLEKANTETGAMIKKAIHFFG